jgi:hypothetical protein
MTSERQRPSWELPTEGSREEILAALEQKLLDGLNSGEPIPMTKELIDDLKEQIKGRYQERLRSSIEPQ